jgi:gamma-glutamylcyclotransferase (GGCT)/AIG2-like uncharacterized protein YtfP
MTFLYAAYGSNLNHKQMATRCPNAEFVGTGKIVGVQLVFRGVADVEPALGSDVSVGLWRVTEDCLQALDRYEGYPSLYDRTIVCVDTPNGEVAEAWVYFMSADYYSLPQQHYFDSIAQGYKDCGLDVNELVYAVKCIWQKTYSKKITELIPFNLRRVLS